MLPSNFIGSSSYCKQNYNDPITIVIHLVWLYYNHGIEDYCNFNLLKITTTNI